MALYLEIGRPWGTLMVSKRSRVRIPTSALFMRRTFLQQVCRRPPCILCPDLSASVRWAEAAKPQ